MNVWSKVLTALRGGITEAGEAVVDTQALRILDQEVRDASEELARSKESLAEILARQKVTEEKCKQLEAKITEHEGYALQAMAKDDEGLALEVASKIAELEAELEPERASAKGFAENADSLRAAIKQSERNIKYLKQQVDTVKAVDNVQRAQAAVAARHSGTDSKLRTAMDSLERIKEKQAMNAAKMEAAAEVSDELAETSLSAKLEAAGITPKANAAEDVMARLKERAAAKGA